MPIFLRAVEPFFRVFLAPDLPRLEATLFLALVPDLPFFAIIELVLFAPGFFAVALCVVDLLAVDLAAVDLLAVALFAEGLLAVELLAVVALFAEGLLAVELVVARFVEDLLAVELLVVALLGAAFLATVVDLEAALFLTPVGFFAESLVWLFDLTDLTPFVMVFLLCEWLQQKYIPLIVNLQKSNENLEEFIRKLKGLRFNRKYKRQPVVFIIYF